MQSARASSALLRAGALRATAAAAASSARLFTAAPAAAVPSAPRRMVSLAAVPAKPAALSALLRTSAAPKQLLPRATAAAPAASFHSLLARATEQQHQQGGSSSSGESSTSPKDALRLAGAVLAAGIAALAAEAHDRARAANCLWASQASRDLDFDEDSETPGVQAERAKVAAALRAWYFREERRINCLRAMNDPLAETYEHSPMTLWEWVKLAVNYTIFPIAWARIAALVPLMVLACALAKVSMLGRDMGKHNRWGMDRPREPSWRDSVLRATRHVIRAALFVAGFHSITVKGKPADAVDAPVVVSNHVSLIDACLLFMIYQQDHSTCASTSTAAPSSSLPAIFHARKAPEPAPASPYPPSTPLPPMFISKEAVVRVPVLSWALLACGAVLVDRSSPSSRFDTQAEITRRARYNDSIRRMREGMPPHPDAPADLTADSTPFPPLLVFPEGTITTGDTLLRFKPGAFRPLVPVQPVVITYPHEFFNPTHAGSKRSELLSVLRLLGQYENKAVVEFLPVTRPGPDEEDSPLRYTDRVRADMARAMDVQLSNHVAY